MIEEVEIVDGQHRWSSGWGPRATSRAPAAGRARGSPGPVAAARCLGCDSDPDLRAGFVEQHVLAPHERDMNVRSRCASLAASYGRMSGCRALLTWESGSAGCPRGPSEIVLDVPGVGLGHTTVWRDEPDPPAGRGVARTGVTVLLPAVDTFPTACPGGRRGPQRCRRVHGIPHRRRSGGSLETPVFLTSTMQVGRVYDAACELLLEREPDVAEDVVIPVVGECDDSWLSATRGACRCPVTMWPLPGVMPRRRSGRARAPEGSVGAGTGMTCLGFKGGIGTSSRVVPSGHTVGVVLLMQLRRSLPADGRWRTRGRLAAHRTHLLRHPRQVPASASSSQTPRSMPDRLRTAGPADRPRAGPDGLDGAPRQRRDLRGAVGGHARRPVGTLRHGARACPLTGRPLHRHGGRSRRGGPQRDAHVHDRRRARGALPRGLAR